MATVKTMGTRQLFDVYFRPASAEGWDVHRRIYGADASWVYSGTDLNAIQAHGHRIDQERRGNEVLVLTARSRHP